MLKEKNLAAQVHAALKTKTNFKAEPTRVEDVEFKDEKFPVFVVPLGTLRGVIPVYETGTGIYDGTKEEFLELSEQEQGEIRRRMITLLTSDFPLNVRVIKIEDGIAFLSRKAALKDITKQTLKELGVKKLEDIKGEVVFVTTMALPNDGAICTVGGITAFLPRFEIDYTNPRPSRVLEIGQRIKVKVTDVKDNELIVSHKALLPDPWDDMDYKEGSVVKAKIIKPQKNGNGFVIALEPGVTGIARNYIPSNIPKPFETVAVRIDVINHKKRYVIGRLVQ